MYDQFSHVIVFKMSDGGVIIRTPPRVFIETDKAGKPVRKIVWNDLSAAAQLARLEELAQERTADLPGNPALSWRIVATDQLPEDMTYRDAWTDDNPTETVDVDPIKKAGLYRALREKEYPLIGDQLDAIWKELNYRRLNGEALIQEADDILNRVLAVKNKYQKPE